MARLEAKILVYNVMSFGLIASLFVSTFFLLFGIAIGFIALVLILWSLFPILQFFIDYTTQFGFEIGMVRAFSFLIWFFTGVIFVASIISNHITDRTMVNMMRIRNGEPPLETNPVIEFFKIQKKKICPIVEYKDY